MTIETVPLDVDSDLEWDRLRSYLRAETAPLALIEVESGDQAEEILEAIRHECDALEVYRPGRDGEAPQNVLDWLASRQAVASPETVFLILGLEELTPEEHDAREFWSWMNLQRERWRTPAGKVVFVLTSRQVDYLCRYAGALWDWIFLKFNLLQAWSVLRNRTVTGGTLVTREEDPATASYLAWASDRHRGLSLIGVGGGEVRLPLEKVYVPLRMAAMDPEPDKERRPHGECTSLAEIFTSHRTRGRHVLVLGEPGAGKTTVLRMLHQKMLHAGPAALGFADGTVPVFLALGRLREDDLETSLGSVLGRELHELSGGLLDAGLGHRLWHQGRLLLLLDGLEEIADDELRAHVCRYLEWQLAEGEKRDVRAVVSCRYSGYGGAVKLGSGFLVLDVRPLDAEQRRHLVQRWFREISRSLPGYSEREACEAAERLVKTLDGSSYGSQRLQALVGSPLPLTLLCVVVLRGGEIPRQRVTFYEQFLRVLLGQWERSKRAASGDWAPPIDVETALAVLRSLAYDLHGRKHRADLPLSEILLHVGERLEQLGKEVSAFQVVRWLHREAGVLRELAPDHYGFLHLGIQEYLAALHVASQGDGLLDELCQRCGDPWWHEVLLLTVALPGRRIFTPLMERLLRSPVLLERPELIRACLDEASEVDLEPLLAWLEPGREPARRAAVLRLVPSLELSEKPRAVSPGGPSALPASGEPFTEPLTGTRFLWIPGGQFSMGGGEYESERPVHWVRISPFWLAETPVTNRQYALFLKQTAHREPILWRDRRFSAPEQPVIGVSWNDAMAYCRWLSEACGLTVTLPTEAQWEFSARGPEGREYPWGAEAPDDSRVCFGLDRDKGKPAAVGSFPVGRGPFGTLDQSGNVWEWCLDAWDASAYTKRGGEIIDPYVEDEDGGDSARVLRGGGWWDPAEYLRAAGRFGGPASLRNGGIGFRLAALHDGPKRPSST